ncbi:MAG: hypothetical protein R3Y50_05090 [Rikenellaceae bacterium]
MNKVWEISIIATLLLLFLVSSIFIYLDNDLKKMDKLVVSISNSDSIRFVTEDDVRELLERDSVKKWLKNYNDCNVNELERDILGMTFVDSADVYKVTDGTIDINIIQKDIKVRIISNSGADYYISKDGELLPTLSRYVADVPIVSCNDVFLKSLLGEEKKNWRNEKKSEINYYFTQNLLNFVKLVESSSFWKSMIVQVKVSDINEIELTTRVGNHQVILCDIADFDKFEEYLIKLRGFYRQVLPSTGWNKYRVINLKYDDIVVTKG